MRSVAQVVLSAALVAGCGQTAETPPAQTVAATTTAPRQVWDLPEPITTITSAHLYALATDTITFDPGTNQNRRCNASVCPGRFMSVANQIPGPAMLGEHGTVVARLENLNASTAAENRYKTPKGGGNTNYYMIAFKDGATDWRWAIYSARRNAPAAEKPQLISEGTWSVCQHAGNHVRERGRFRSCPGTTATTTTGAGTTSGAIITDGDPGWLSCSAGCCTAGQ